MQYIYLENNMIPSEFEKKLPPRNLIVEVVLPVAARAKMVLVAGCGRRYGINSWLWREVM